MPKHYYHLTYEQRCQLYVLVKREIPQREIARELGVSQSTISRELRRNCGKRGYRYRQAQRLADARSLAAKSVARRMTPPVIAEIELLLRGNQWSPVQISGQLALQGIRVSHETIYRHVWQDKRAGGDLFKHLRRRGKKRCSRSSKNAGRGLILGRVDIADRPAIVNEKSRLGDWELDSIIGAKHRGSIVSMVERRSKLTLLALQPGATAEATTDSLLKRLGPIQAHVLTLTSDNGKEFAGHQKVSQKLGAEFYFCTPYHSWERGLNEHTNGLVRQYFPKGMDFDTLTHEDVQRVEELLNNRPRKILNFLSPNQVFQHITNQKLDALRI